MRSQNPMLLVSKSLCLDISTAKPNGKKYLQRTPLSNPMKVGSLRPEIGGRGYPVGQVLNFVRPSL
jgi:hypothetical protein